jgi:type II secretory pathway pseudopilin PulG
MILFLSLLAIAALAVLPDIALQIKRDREEELIHRGLGYSRGIRRYYKKFGRYPTKIEDLENTNTLRFIRKRYKDPVTGEDFKILRVGDVVMGGLMIGTQGPNLQGAPGVTLPAGSVPGANVGPGTSQQIMVNPTGSNPTGGDSGNAPDTQTNPKPSGSSSSSSSSSSDTSSSTQQVFGGGPMLGVVSTNKGKTIREFCKKSHYKDWYFIYDPTADRGGPLNSPWCPLAAQPLLGNPLQSQGGQAPTNPRSPQGGMPLTQSPPPNPGAQMPPEQ